MMSRVRRLILAACVASFGGGVITWSCGFDDTLREYLDTHFWLPLARSGRHLVKGNVPESNAPYAGRGKADGDAPIERLRAKYRAMDDCAGAPKVVAAVLANPALSRLEREEAELIDAKIAMRCGSAEQPETLHAARAKFEAFLKSARDPHFLSEARGWIAHIYYSLGDQTAAGKIYLDELNRTDSNLSRETILNSLRLTYRYDGGPKLLEHLDEYFDTPEHALFAINLVTNPRWEQRSYYDEPDVWGKSPAIPYERIKTALDGHGELFRSPRGAELLASLSMRTALRAGDPPAALRIAAKVPAGAAVRRDPDFLWMLASAHFLSKHYAAAETPLLRMFALRETHKSNKAVAAYALCGVYQKTGNFVEQIRFALWLQANSRQGYESGLSYPSVIEDQSVYWAFSGFDLGLLLDTEAPIAALRSFLDRYPSVGQVRLVKYALAVRLARENQYEESAEIYRSIKVAHRAARMDRMAKLYGDAYGEASPEAERLKAKLELATYLAANSDRLYFNDALWSGFQRYALRAGTDSRLNAAERKRLIAGERKLKDEQEELWRAHLILREVVKEAGPGALGRRAASLGIQCVRRLSGRFERAAEIRKADIELSRWLARHP